MQKVFIAGCGYIGERLAAKYNSSGAEVTCMVRSTEHASRLQAAGYNVIVSSMEEISGVPLPDWGGSVLFYLVPPPGGGISDSRAGNFIEVLSKAARPEKIIYMSATSVYGADSGPIVTEESPAIPETAMGKRRLDAENAFRCYGAASGVPVVILRVSGIYGPGRLPLMQISEGQPLLKEEESGPSNRIHADDLASVCAAAAQYAGSGDIFNVSDGNPSSMTSYFNACADLLGYPRQPQVTMEEARLTMTPLMLSYVSQSRIVDNRRMLENLKVRLQYATLTAGLAASIPPEDLLPNK